MSTAIEKLIRQNQLMSREIDVLKTKVVDIDILKEKLEHLEEDVRVKREEQNVTIAHHHGDLSEMRPRVANIDGIRTGVHQCSKKVEKMKIQVKTIISMCGGQRKVRCVCGHNFTVPKFVTQEGLVEDLVLDRTDSLPHSSNSAPDIFGETDDSVEDVPEDLKNVQNDDHPVEEISVENFPIQVSDSQVQTDRKSLVDVETEMKPNNRHAAIQVTADYRNASVQVDNEMNFPPPTAKMLRIVGTNPFNGNYGPATLIDPDGQCEFIPDTVYHNKEYLRKSWNKLIMYDSGDGTHTRSSGLLLPAALGGWLVQLGLFEDGQKRMKMCVCLNNYPYNADASLPMTLIVQVRVENCMVEGECVLDELGYFKHAALLVTDGFNAFKRPRIKVKFMKK